MLHVLEHYNWTSSGIKTFVDNITVAYNRQLQVHTAENYQRVLKQASQVSRVIVVCLTSDLRRPFMLAAKDGGFTSPDYVYLFIQSTGTSFLLPTPIWESEPTDGRDTDAHEAFKSVLLLDKPVNVLPADYNSKAMDLVTQYPWDCYECPTLAKNASLLSFYLGDSVLAYIYALNKTVEMYKSYPNLPQIIKNSTLVLQNIPDGFVDLEGETLYLYFKKSRILDFALYGLDTAGNQQRWAYTTTLGDKGFMDSRPFIENYTDAATTIWATREGIQPLNEPLCGFLGNKCPVKPWVLPISIAAGCLTFVINLLLFLFCIYLFQRNRRRQLNKLWQVDFNDIEFPDETISKGTKSTRSVRTIASDSYLSAIDNSKTNNIKFMYLNHELVIAWTSPILSDKELSPNEKELRELRMLEHPNLNRFLGMTVGNGNLYILWRYCERGSIENFIEDYKDKIDDRIIHSMISQIVEALYFIHNSPYSPLAVLSADSCVVNDRFEVKVQYCGMNNIKKLELFDDSNRKTLYVAPEILRRPNRNIEGSKEGDIYSFGILTSQIATKTSVWRMKEKDLTVEEILFRVRQRTVPLERPSVQRADGLEMDARLESLILQCYSEEPAARPDIRLVRDRIRCLEGNSKKSNFMDYMFALMENTAVDLEQQVQYRTAELVEEQRRAEVLLNRMMPQKIVELLRKGESITPEVYENATVYFSDVVGFTILSSKSTPLQVINFLNNMYTISDDIIERHKVYKVETIGDGLHCVSGIPTRNGNDHVKDICDMALAIREGVKSLRMPHLPSEMIQIRLGIHSGACVTGIVGMTAPRYCVFGDTVNLAAKMESTGKPSQIQISFVTKNLIDQHFPTLYKTEHRGEVYIKNRDPVETYWLLSKNF
ncbi:unnamed protein product [Bursaphelenchus okinawaensis]|uniref:Guanylate cyclase n=1 Tax=Bursaphelenchus okinawaensis TaxID=465554 RepID=A0A811LBE8_9BILA|nr:unnamed protein product [Bursaphelenchus okinawaensis]CAG9120928.1 unnamed protein product [Bursaphelenchus okinawaensis]